MPAVERQSTATTVSASTTDLSLIPGFAPWITSTSLTHGGDLAQMPKFDADTGEFAHVVTIKHSDAFELKPVCNSYCGPLRGSHVLVLKPFTKYFRFLELPLGIRRMIYDELLLDPLPIYITSWKLKDEARRAVSVKHLYLASSVMAVNKQILQEALPTMYGGNLPDVLTDVGMMRNQFRHIAFSNHAYQKSKARGIFFKLKDTKGLRSITFSHREFGKVTLWRRHTWTVGSVAADCKTIMMALHKSRKRISNLPTVLDIIQITWSKCFDCRTAFPAGDNGCCECLKRSNVGKTLQRQVSQAVAESLGLNG